jgi:hypothetical protein
LTFHFEKAVPTAARISSAVIGRSLAVRTSVIRTSTFGLSEAGYRDIFTQFEAIAATETL